MYRVPLAGKAGTLKLAIDPSVSAPDSCTVKVESALPETDTALAVMSASTALMVIEAVAALADCRPLSSIALYWKDVLPFQSPFGLKYSVAALLLALMSAPATSACVKAASVYSVPLAGTTTTLKLARVPLVSFPDKLIERVLSALPLAVTVLAVGVLVLVSHTLIS